MSASARLSCLLYHGVMIEKTPHRKTGIAESVGMAFGDTALCVLVDPFFEER